MMDMEMITICLKATLFILLAVGAYFLVRAAYHMDPAGRLREKMDDLERRRRMDTETAGKKPGYFEKYLDNLDERLTQAGVRKYLPGPAGVEIYFVLNVLEFTLIFCLTGKGILMPFVVAALAVYTNHLALDMMRFINRKRIERQLLEMMNLVSDYSLSESEITMILYKCGQTLANPLKDLLVKCHISARSTGNVEQSLYELRRSVDHFLFKEILLLLELCSRSDNDYQRVINGCRDMVNRYLREEKEKASVVRSLLGEAAVMTAVAAYGISMMLKEFAGDLLTDASFVGFFLREPAGQVSLAAYTVLAVIMVQVILRFAKR